MSREDAQMKIRLPAELKELLENVARANGRSLNAEVLQRLRSSFPAINKLESQNTHAFLYLRQAEGMGLGREAESLLNEWGKNIEKNTELLERLHELVENRLGKK